MNWNEVFLSPSWTCITPVVFHDTSLEISKRVDIIDLCVSVTPHTISCLDAAVTGVKYVSAETSHGTTENLLLYIEIK